MPIFFIGGGKNKMYKKKISGVEIYSSPRPFVLEAIEFYEPIIILYLFGI